MFALLAGYLTLRDFISPEISSAGVFIVLLLVNNTGIFLVGEAMYLNCESLMHLCYLPTLATWCIVFVCYRSGCFVGWKHRNCQPCRRQSF